MDGANNFVVVAIYRRFNYPKILSSYLYFTLSMTIVTEGLKNTIFSLFLHSYGLKMNSSKSCNWGLLIWRPPYFVCPIPFGCLRCHVKPKKISYLRRIWDWENTLHEYPGFFFVFWNISNKQIQLNEYFV